MAVFQEKNRNIGNISHVGTLAEAMHQGEKYSKGSPKGLPAAMHQGSEYSAKSPAKKKLGSLMKQG